MRDLKVLSIICAIVGLVALLIGAFTLAASINRSDITLLDGLLWLIMAVVLLALYATMTTLKQVAADTALTAHAVKSRRKR